MTAPQTFVPVLRDPEATASHDMTTPQSGSAPKRRRLRGSCDSCAHRKIKCDAILVGPDTSCTNCITFNTRCTKDRGGRHDVLLQYSLLTWIEFASARSLVTSISRTRTYSPPTDQSIQQKNVLELVAYAQHLERSYSALKNRIPASTSERHSPTNSSIDCENGPANLTADLPYGEFSDQEDDIALDVKSNHLNGEPSGPPRFFGPLSNISLIKNAFEELKIGDSPYFTNLKGPHNPFRRARYWLSPSWTNHFFIDEPRRHEFPPQDLLNSLIDIFFIFISPYMPVLSQPSFLKSVSEGLHYYDPLFGDLVLAVCAVSSRHSTDPRTSCPGLDHSTGWKYFRQIRISPNFATPISLHEIQTASICICYLFEAPPPLGTYCWPILGLAIRLSQDIGLHRSREPSTPSNEPWRRAFWTLIAIDIILSAAHGRPRATCPTDYDLAPIAEIDDNCWDTFQQPEGKPSTMAYFNQFLKLLHILSLAQRTLFSVKKPTKGDLKTWTSDVLRRLNADLAKWRTELPEHLCWNLNQNNPIFFTQAAYLQAMHSWIVILIYRPFIPLRPQNLPFSLSALAESVTAARTCTTVLYALYERNIPLALPQFAMGLLGSGVVLVLEIRMGRKRGIATDTSLDIQYVEKIMKIFKSTEDRFISSGRFHDILDEMVHFDQPTEKHSTVSTAASSSKRRVGQDEPPPMAGFDFPPVAGPPTYIGNSFAFQSDPNGVASSPWDHMNSFPEQTGSWDFAMTGGGLSDWDNMVAAQSFPIPQPSSPTYYVGDHAPDLTQTSSQPPDFPFTTSNLF